MREPWLDRESRRRVRAPRACATLVPLLTALPLAGCASYAPEPLDAEGHDRAYRARDLEGDSLQHFLARLDRLELDERAEFDPTDGIDPREGELVARVFSPEVRLARAEARLPLASAEHAGRLDDPELSAELLRVARSVPDPWIAEAALAFTIPLGDRLDAEREVSSAEVRTALARVREVEWNVTRNVRAAWIAWSTAAEKVAVGRAFASELDDQARVAGALADAGELSPAEAARFEILRARHANEQLALEAEADDREARLREALGLAPDAGVDLLPWLGPVGEDLPRSPERNPTLARLREEYDVAEGNLREAVARQVPDLTIGPRLESDEGQWNWGLLSAIPLPLFRGNRRAIAEARAARGVARAAYESAHEQVVSRLDRARARAGALARRRAHGEEVVAPLVDRQVRDTAELLRLGEVSTTVLLESLVDSHRTKLELLDLRRDEALARVELERLTGPRRPGDAR